MPQVQAAKKLDPKTMPPVDPNQRYTIAEAIAYLRTSRQSFYKRFVNTGQIATIEQGSRRYVPGTEIARLSTATSANS